MNKVPIHVTRERERRAWELVQHGWSHQEIADELKVERSTVTKMLGRLSARYYQENLVEVKNVKAQQVAQLLRVYREAMDAWEKSKLPKKKLRKRSKKSAGVEEEETESGLEERAGDVQYLIQAREALADIRKITGADAPLRRLNINMAHLSDEQLRRLQEGEDPLSVVIEGTARLLDTDDDDGAWEEDDMEDWLEGGIDGDTSGNA